MREMPEGTSKDHHYALIDSLTERGPDDLSDFELLTILFGGCVPLAEAESCAREFTREIGPPASLQSMDFCEITWIKGIGEAKAAAIIAGVELGRRSERRASRGKAPLFPLDTTAAILPPRMSN